MYFYCSYQERLKAVYSSVIVSRTFCREFESSARNASSARLGTLTLQLLKKSLVLEPPKARLSALGMLLQMSLLEGSSLSNV